MYKLFTDENDLEVKTRHDLTALMLDLEGGGRPSKPALSLKCIDASEKSLLQSPSSAGGTRKDKA